MTAENPAGVLSGIRVLDFTAFVSGPYCTRLLADMGAEVIKIEPPGGDMMRLASPVRDGRSAMFGQVNCGKKSVVLDLKQPRAVAAARDLAAKSDVLVENFRPGVMARLGLGYEDIKALKANIVYCSISGFGQNGPDAGRAAYAPIIQAASGFDMAQLAYQPGRDKPAPGRNVTADILGSTHAAAAINAALFHRARAGGGQYIDVALMDGMHNVMPAEFQHGLFPDQDFHLPIYEPMRTLDGFVIVMPVTDKNFAALAAAIDRPDLTADPRFAARDGRFGNWAALVEIIESWTARRTSKDCDDALSAAGCPCARYLTVAESVARPQVAARGAVVEVEDGAGTFLVPNAPFQFADSDVGARPWVPDLGQHTSEVLADVLGLSADEIAEIVPAD